MLTDEELCSIEERQKQRQEFRADLPRGQWLYDSFGTIENCNDIDAGARVGRADRIFILIRRRAWIDALMKACGDDILDQATYTRGDDKDLQPADVGQYIEKMMDGSAEKDIELLLGEIRRLRNPHGSK
jgi:hypothetical protein